MSVSSTPQRAQESRTYAYAYEDEDRGYGWVVFAGILLLMLGTLNFIEGIAAIGNAHFFVANTHYIAGSLDTHGVGSSCASASLNGPSGAESSSRISSPGGPGSWCSASTRSSS